MKPAPGESLFLWLWRAYLARHRAWLLVALVLMAIEGGSLAVFAAQMQPMFDRVFVAGDGSAIWEIGAVVLAIFFARAVTSMGHRIILTQINERTSAKLRADLLAHLMRLDGSFHQRHPPGYLIERVQGDVAAINRIWSGIITGLGRDFFAVLALFAVALSVDWRWTLLALVGIPILIAPSLIVQRFIRRRAARAREVAARMSVRLDEVFHGINAIKLNGLEPYQTARYDALIEDRIRTEVNAAAGQAAIPALIDIMTGIGFVGVLVFGGAEIIAGEKTVGQFMTFFTAMSVAFEPLRRLGNLSGLWQSAAASVERMRAIFEAEPTLTSPARPLPPPQGAPEIVLTDVHLAYSDLPVLRGASFTAAAGRTTALVGASGAGKSTVFNLLTRLVDPQSGSVTIGGIPTSAMRIEDLRALFSVVTQDALLFDETIRENILLGRRDVTKARLHEVLDAAHVSEFLPQLAQGLDTPAGPRGSALSGGQRQRVAIARALLRDTPILLLDEATSALDTRSEAMVQSALDRLAHGRTTLVIAHRLSTVRSADSIVVMEAGRVVDHGPHEALLARGGLYADLHALQFRDRPEEPS